MSQLLKKGASGSEVTALQQQLAAKGFAVGAIDGKFGEATEKALMAFQKSAGLTPDGIAGAKTFAALGMSTDSPPATFAATSTATETGLFTVDVVCRMFPKTRRQNIEKHLPAVLAAMEKFQLGDRAMILMALGTIRAETEGFVPISEGISKYNTEPGGRPFGKYDFRKASLGNNAAGDGDKFKGRGFIQLTGRANYDRIGRNIGLGAKLLENPELANDSAIASDILAAFLRAKESLIRKDLSRFDLASARKRVNGGHHGLDRFSSAFKIGAKAVGLDGFTERSDMEEVPDGTFVNPEFVILEEERDFEEMVIGD
jgi:peptidoglycan L-alanyl-D-glutamate endopeptidase CwlK